VLELARTASAACDAADLDFITRELPVAAAQAMDGLDRVGGIVQTMKVFSHQQSRASSIDLNQAVANTLTLARNEYKYVADIETSYGELPPVLCHGGEINQVLLNLVLNAAQAVAEVSAATKARGRIAVSTRRDGDMVAIDIRDTGSGVPESIRGRIFEPFFTTKDVGKGTGQGLAIAHSVIARHHGTLTFETATGLGTTFQIRLPIQAHSQPTELAA
jgi:signal transduction histidine kinase